jgi:hypothetical protein
MTNLTKLIERRQGENKSLIKELRMVSNMINMGEKIQWGQDTFLMDKAADALESTQTTTEAYRQALEDILAGLPEPSNPRGPWESGSSDGYNTALQTVRAQIEGLLGNTKDV